MKLTSENMVTKYKKDTYKRKICMSFCLNRVYFLYFHTIIEISRYNICHIMLYAKTY